MSEMPVSGPYAEYLGRRFLILFGGDGWAALRAAPDIEVPDAIDRGTKRVGAGQVEHWAKVPDSAINAIVDVDVSAKLAGHTVSVRGQLPDGRIRVWFVGSPDAAQDMGLTGDQFMGWAGLVDPDDLQDIHVEERRRA